MKKKEYALKENDIIKLGRVKYRVKELNAFEEMESLQNIDKVENNDERVYFINYSPKPAKEFSDTNSLEEDMPKQHLIKQVYNLTKRSHFLLLIVLKAKNYHAEYVLIPRTLKKIP